MRRIVLAAALAALPTLATAQFETMQLATELGAVLGSESVCGFSFDQAAIQKFIEEKAPAGDMSFASTLPMMVQGTEFNLQSLSASAKTAHCAAVGKTARHFGFMP